MKLYLVQHGESKPESEDPARPLTNAGRAAVEQVGYHLFRAALLAADVVIRHSGKLRAAQTARILASCLRLAWRRTTRRRRPSGSSPAAAAT